MSKKISVLGSTGSIGTQALEVCEKHGFDVIAVAAHSSIKLLAEQVRRYNPEYACVFNEDKYAEFKALVSDTDTEVLCGMEGLC